MLLPFARDLGWTILHADRSHAERRHGRDLRATCGAQCWGRGGHERAGGADGRGNEGELRTSAMVNSPSHTEVSTCLSANVPFLRGCVWREGGRQAREQHASRSRRHGCWCACRSPTPAAHVMCHAPHPHTLCCPARGFALPMLWQQGAWWADMRT